MTVHPDHAMRMKARRPFVWASTLLSLVVTACSGSIGTSAPSNATSASAPVSITTASPDNAERTLPADGLLVATTVAGFPGMDALGGGTIGAERRGGEVCFWATNGHGSSARREALVWPHGFSARDHPLTLIGPDGQALLHVGDEVALGGGVLGSIEPGSPYDRCEIGSVFWVSGVDHVNGRLVNVGEGSLHLVTRPAGQPISCSEAPLEGLMLVMWHGHLQLTLGPTGETFEATWPPGYRAVSNRREDDLRIRVIDPSGRVVLTQGVETGGLRGQFADGRLNICEVADAT